MGTARSPLGHHPVTPRLHRIAIAEELRSDQPLTSGIVVRLPVLHHRYAQLNLNRE
jgi:hypothetical protein